MGLGKPIRNFQLQLRKAIQQPDKYCLSIRYVDYLGKDTTRTVSPYRVIRNNGNEFLECLDLTNESLRHFRVDRINECITVPADSVLMPEQVVSHYTPVIPIPKKA